MGSTLIHTAEKLRGGVALSKSEVIFLNIASLTISILVGVAITLILLAPDWHISWQAIGATISWLDYVGGQIQAIQQGDTALKGALQVPVFRHFSRDAAKGAAKANEE